MDRTISQRNLSEYKYSMTLQDKINLPPLKKYRIHNKFPVKLILHILLVIMTTYQVVVTENTLISHKREML